jgi:hypothetical protein
MERGSLIRKLKGVGMAQAVKMHVLFNAGFGGKAIHQSANVTGIQSLTL